MLLVWEVGTQVGTDNPMVRLSRHCAAGRLYRIDIVLEEKSG